jgi:hypothetical protein
MQTKSTESGSGTRFTSAAGMATRSAKDRGPVKPGWVWCGQTGASPVWQNSHTPQPPPSRPASPMRRQAPAR